jgi:hypothetical protein
MVFEKTHMTADLINKNEQVAAFTPKVLVSRGLDKEFKLPPQSASVHPIKVQRGRPSSKNVKKRNQGS